MELRDCNTAAIESQMPQFVVAIPVDSDTVASDLFAKVLAQRKLSSQGDSAQRAILKENPIDEPSSLDCAQVLIDAIVNVIEPDETITIPLGGSVDLGRSRIFDRQMRGMVTVFRGILV